MKDSEQQLFVCDCGNVEHQIVLEFDPDEDDSQWALMFLSYHLYQYKGFFRRLMVGLRYAFGHRSKYGDFGEMILNKEIVQNLYDFLGKFLEYVNPIPDAANPSTVGV